MLPETPLSFYEAIVESSDDAIISKTLKGIVTSWNGAAARMFGRSAEEMIGQPMATVFPPDRLQEEVIILRRIAAGETVDHFETVRLRRDGTPFHVSVTISPIRDSAGRIVGASKIARDISGRIEQEAHAAALASEARRLSAIIESSDDAIVGTTLQGIVTSWNRGAERLFGYSAEEMIGRPLATVIPLDRLDEEDGMLERISRGEKVAHFETVRLRKDGVQVHVSVTISPIFDADGRVVGASKIARDITGRIQAERTIWQQANFDMLTQLPNRRQFHETLRLELVRARRSQRRVAVLFIDLDHFKDVNDRHGHECGDSLLQQAAERIKGALREIDTVARMGGDEFTVVLPDIGRADEVQPIAQRLNQRLFAPFVLGDVPLQISGSIGVALFPEDGQTVDELLRHADQAMYESKRLGRNRTSYFVHRAQPETIDRLQLVTELRHAVERQQLRLHYQPILNLADGSVHKCEALLRWQHPVHGLISPMVFIPLAEETGLIREIGDWVFETAARQAHDWRQRVGASMQVSLNLSPAQLHGEMAGFQRWIQLLKQLGLPGAALVVEITESMMVDRSDDTTAKLRTLREAGIQIAVDDFGTGYSSLSSLSRLDVNYLKIDQSFTRELAAGNRVLALCEAIVVMAHKLGLEVVAEGIETEAQAALLRQIGCGLGQGWLFARAVPAAEAERLFSSAAPARSGA